MATRSKSRKTRRSAEGGTSTALVSALHQIYLAGLGAASRARSGAPGLFEELVAEGARVQTETGAAAGRAFQAIVGDAQAKVSARVGQVRGQAADALEGLEKMFQTRVHRALTQLGVPSAEQLSALSKRVDALNANIERLAPRPPARRAARRKPAGPPMSAP
jgi:poly(hydroxyalkanoate) granule-associated protein